MTTTATKAGLEYLAKKLPEYIKLEDETVVKYRDFLVGLVDSEIDKKKRERKAMRISNSSSNPEQARQWDFLLLSWPVLAILSSLSAILSAIIFQYAMAIIMALIFLGAIGIFFVGAFRYVILALFLMIYLFVGFLFSVFYAIVMMQDFYGCESSSCAEWRLFLFEINYIANVFVAGVLFLTVRVCWLIIMHQRQITSLEMQRRRQQTLDQNKKRD